MRAAVAAGAAFVSRIAYVVDIRNAIDKSTEDSVNSNHSLRMPGKLCLSALIVITLAGCASLAPKRGVGEIEQATAARGLPAPKWTADTKVDSGTAIGAEPITLQRALVLAFERNPEVRALYAELGIAQSEVLEASRLSNLRLDYASLRGGDERQISRGIAMPFTDLLMLPFKSRLARDTFAVSRNRVAASLVELAAEVEAAWFEYVTAQQIAEMRSLVSRAAESSAEYAERLHQAGNISPRNYALELAAASEARISAARAAADTARARNDLANLLAVRAQDAWQTPKVLPAVPAKADSFTDIDAAALAGRLDLSAARSEVEVAERTLVFLRRWRWLGVVEVGYESESEPHEVTVKGPTIGWELPLFNWNSSGILRQTAEVEIARANLAALELSVRNEVSLAANELATAREVSESYRTALLPQREAVVGRTFEEFNYMLTDAFELLQAKREQFEAYEEYLEAVKDFWIARGRLRRFAGGDLPGDDIQTNDTIGVDQLMNPVPPAQQQPADHSQHQGHTP
jgi:cobalt-zinc-cadmium efflux system outer membrane protein